MEHNLHAVLKSIYHQTGTVVLCRDELKNMGYFVRTKTFAIFNNDVTKNATLDQYVQLIKPLADYMVLHKHSAIIIESNEYYDVKVSVVEHVDTKTEAIAQSLAFPAGS